MYGLFKNLKIDISQTRIQGGGSKKAVPPPSSLEISFFTLETEE